MLIALAGPAPSYAAEPAPVSVASGKLVRSDAAFPPADSADWRPVKLPLRQPRAREPELQTFWFLATFQLGKMERSMSSLLLPSLPNGGKIYLNGMLAADLGTSTPQTWSRRFRPFMLDIAPGQLREGSNTIAIRFAVRDPTITLGDFRLGPRAALQPEFDAAYFWKVSSYQYTNTLCLFMGAFALVFWLRRRNERSHLYFGVCSLLWGVRTLVAFIPEFPAEYWQLWRFGCYFTTGAFLVSVTLVPLRLVGFRSALLDRALLAHWGLGLAAFALFGKRVQPLIDTVWHIGFFPFGLLMFWHVALNAWRKPSAAHIAMLATAVGVIVLSLHDLIAMNGWLGTAPVFLLHIGVPALLLAMLCSIMDRLLFSLEMTENVNDRLTSLARLRESELLAQYEKQKQLAYQHAASHERQRIMQEMHDGLGGKLLEARQRAIDSDLPATAVVPLLEESLDEMRMVIGSLSSSNPDLVAALWEFRYRLITRLTRAGGKLNWRTENLPDSLHVNSYSGMHLLYILNDAVNNLVRQGKVQPLSVAIAYQSSSMELRVQGVSQPATGNASCIALPIQQRMQRRAQAIGAVISFNSQDGGCILQWQFPSVEPVQIISAV